MTTNLILKAVGAFFSRFRSGGITQLSIDTGYPIPGPINAYDPTIALQSSAVWACCRLISQSIASLPGRIYQTTAEGSVRAINHPLWTLLTAQPNPVMTLYQWIQTTVLHLMLYGNAFTIPETDADGQIIALWPLLPPRVQTRVNLRAGNVYSYRWTDFGGVQHEVDPTALMHFRLFSIDGITGLSPIDYHRTTLMIEGASSTFAMNMYLNGGRPPGVLEYPGTLTPQQFADIRASWKSVHGGPQNAGNIVVLEGGTKYTALGLPPADMEYIEQSKFSVEQIARLYGVPSHLIGAMEKPTYASVEQQALEYLQYCLQPIVTNLEKHIAALLLGPGFFYKFNLATFERSDIKSRYGAYAVARQWGWMSVNDIRELEDLNRIGPEGDVYLQPLNMVPATDAAAQLAAQANAEATALGNQQGVI